MLVTIFPRFDTLKTMAVPFMQENHYAILVVWWWQDISQQNTPCTNYDHYNNFHPDEQSLHFVLMCNIFRN